MTTRLSDVVQHDKEFLATVMQKMTAKSVMRASGVVVGNPALDARAHGAGKITSIPFYNPLAQTESAVASDDPSVLITPGKIGQGEQLAVVNVRSQAWSSMDLTAQLLADDPIGAIAQRVGEYWGQDEELMVINILKGLLAANVAGTGDMVYATGASHDASANLDIDALIDAAGTAGDFANMFDTLIIHSAVHRNLQKNQANNYIPQSDTNLGFGLYAGYKVVVTDNMPFASSVYTSVLCAPGAILAGEGAAKTPVEHFRNPAAGNGAGEEQLYNRRQFILHPNGCKFLSASVAGASPTNAELATAGNWAESFNRKNIGLAFIKSAG